MKLAVDAVIFGYSREDGLSVLLIQRKYPPFKDSWALPGGFVKDAESLEEAVHRELAEETGVAVQFLEQLYTFGDPKRDPRQRIVSVAYVGLVKTAQFRELKASTDASAAQWHHFKNLPELAFDHGSIIQAATERLRNKLTYQPIGFELLDKRFAFSDLEHLYATLLDQPLNRRNFSKKILSFEFLEETGELSKPAGKGRPSKIYKFNEKRYKSLLKEGFHFQV
ncbi:MAG: NUDIX domain-containing protein [Chitinophagaceae bacterium]